MATINWLPGYRRTLTILSGQTTSSDTIDLGGLGARRKLSLSFIAPDTLPEVINVEIADTLTGTFQPQHSGGTPIQINANGITTITDVIGGALRLVAGGAVAADRVFTLMGNKE